MDKLNCAGTLALSLLVMTATPGWAKDASWDARLTAVNGEVSVAPSGGEAATAEVGLPIEDGDRVTTGAGASAEITLDGESLITLGENADFTMHTSAKKASEFELALGSLLAKIKTLGRGGMTVRTPTSVLAVRGTEFAVDVDAEQSRVGVFDEGRVEVRDRDGGNAQTLTANQETFIPRGGPPRRPEPLRVFAQRREMMRGQVQRLGEIKREWRRMPAGDRRSARQNFLERGNRENRGSGGHQDRREPARENNRNGPPMNDRRGPPSSGDRNAPQPSFGPRNNDDRRGPPPGGNDDGRRKPPPGGGRR